MIIDENLMQIQDSLDNLFEAVKSSTTYRHYRQAQQAMAADTEIQQEIQAFQTIRAQYSQIEDYGQAAPGFLQVQTAVVQAKRHLDLNPKVSAFKQAETDFENLLGQISLQLADSISPKIKVAAGNPFFALDRRPHQR